MWRITTLALVLLAASEGPLAAQDAETNGWDWVRIGDAQADRAEPGSLELALAAYAHVLGSPSDPDYTIALARTAWVYFLLDRTPEAIARFAELVDRVDGENPSSAPLRAEAMDLLGAMFADPDWDRDARPDADGTLARLTDGTLIAQDRAWLSELTFETAHALYLSARDPAAIALLDYALSRWPTPEMGTDMAAACRRHRARQEAMHGGLPPTPEADAVCARRSLP